MKDKSKTSGEKVKSIVFIVIILSISFGIYKLKSTKYYESEPKIFNSYIEDSANTYKKYNRSNFPTTGYVLNTTKSACENNSIVTQNADKTINIETDDKYEKCTLYFDKDSASASEHTITFDGGGVTIEAGKSVSVSSGSTSVTVPSIKKDGYTLDGWYDDKGIKILNADGTIAGNASDGITDGKTINLSGDTTLYAKWNTKTYLITYNGNNCGTPSREGDTVSYGSTFGDISDNGTKVGLATISKEGYTFKSWNTKSDGTGTNITNESKVDLNDNTSLYAICTPIKYTIKLDGNGNTNTTSTINNISATYDKDVTLPNNTYTKDGYGFKEWNTKSDGTGTSYSDKSTIKNLTSKDGDTITLYAIWASMSYKMNDKLYANIDDVLKDTVSTSENKVYVINDTDLKSTFPKDRNISLDLQDHTVKMDLTNSGVTKVTNGNITDDGGANLINNSEGANLSLSDLNISSSSSKLTSLVNNSGTITIADGTYKSASTEANKTTAVTNNSTGVLTLNGGTYSSVNTAAIINNGISTINGNITMSGEAKSFDFQNNAKSTLNLSKGTIISSDAYVFTNMGTTNIDGKIVFNTAAQNSVPFLSYGETNIKEGANISSSLTTISALIENFGTLNMTTSTMNSPASNGLIYNAGTANLSGTLTWTSAGAASFYSVSGSTLNLTGGTVSNTDNYPISNEGTMNVTGKVNFTNTTTKNSAIANTGDGIVNFNEGTDVSSYGPVISNDATMNIYKGTFSSTNDDAIDNMGTANIQGDMTMSSKSGLPNFNNSGGTVNLISGTITSGDTNAIISTGTVNATGTVNFTNTTTEYNLIVNKSSGTLNIKENANLTSGANTIDNEGTLNITGGTVKALNDSAIYNYGNATINGNLTMSSQDGTINFYNDSSGTLDLVSGAITSGDTNAIGNAGTMNVTGTINFANTTTEANPIYNMSSGTLNIKDNANITGGTSVIYNQGTPNVTGGTIKSLNDTAIYNSGIASINGNTSLYSNSDAMSFYNDTNSTLNLVNGTITAEDKNVIENHGTLNVTGTIDFPVKATSKVIIFNDSDGTLNLKDKADVSAVNTIISSSGTMNISGATLSVQDHSPISNFGTATISGDLTMSTQGQSVLFANETDGKITISSGTVKSTVDSNIFHNLGSITMTGGTVQGYNLTSTVMNMKNATYTMSGGTVSAGNSHAFYNYGTLRLSGTAKVYNNSRTYPTVYNVTGYTYSNNINTRSGGYLRNNGGGPTVGTGRS